MWLVFILISAVLLAAWILMLRRDVMHEPNTQVFSIYPLGIIVVLPIIALSVGQPVDFGILFTNIGFLLLVKTAAVAISLFCVSLALKDLPLTVVGPLRNVNPLFVGIMAFFLLGESLSYLNILGLLIVVGAVILLDVDIRHPKNLKEFKKHVQNPAALLLILAAFVISFAPILDRLIIERVNIFTNLWWFSFFMAILYWIIHIIKNRELPVSNISVHEILWLLLSGITLMAADLSYLLALSFPGAMIAMIIGVRRLSNLFLTIFGGTILHENHAVYKGFICLIMIGGTILLVL
ncbi:EamA family transporter [Candidatus Woesearchaeota archaeon]|nr:EamA family transporter [Candidatus Woesearchaeota archaeon]